VGNDLDLLVRHLIDAAQQLAGLVAITTTFDDAATMRSITLALSDRWLGQHRMERGYHRHGEARQQHEDVGAGFAAENSEFVLQAHGIEPAGIQKVRCTQIFFDIAVLDLESDRRRIIVGLAMIGHRHDAGLQVRA